jgi:hypothetical protein
MLLSVNSTPTDDDDSTAPKIKSKKKNLSSSALTHFSIHPSIRNPPPPTLLVIYL